MNYNGPDALDAKLNEHFSGKAVRKDLLHQIKKSTNVPSFVLEFLLARYCATDDPKKWKLGCWPWLKPSAAVRAPGRG